TEDVDAGEAHRIAGRLDARPPPRVRPGRRPPARDDIAIADEEVDVPVEVRERGPKVGGDALLPVGAGLRVAAAEVVPRVLVGDNPVGSVQVAASPHLVVEAAYQRLVRVRAHPPSISG